MWSGFCLCNMFRAATCPGQERDGPFVPLARPGSWLAQALRRPGGPMQVVWQSSATLVSAGSPCATHGTATLRRPIPALLWDCRGQRAPLHLSQGCPREGQCRLSAPFGQAPSQELPPARARSHPGRLGLIQGSTRPGFCSAILFTLVGLATDGCAPSGPQPSLARKRGGYRGLGQSASDRWTQTSHQTEPRERRPHPQQQRQTGRWSA